MSSEINLRMVRSQHLLFQLIRCRTGFVIADKIKLGEDYSILKEMYYNHLKKKIESLEQQIRQLEENKSPEKLNEMLSDNQQAIVETAKETIKQCKDKSFLSKLYSFFYSSEEKPVVTIKSKEVRQKKPSDEDSESEEESDEESDEEEDSDLESEEKKAYPQENLSEEQVEKLILEKIDAEEKTIKQIDTDKKEDKTVKNIIKGFSLKKLLFVTFLIAGSSAGFLAAKQPQVAQQISAQVQNIGAKIQNAVGDVQTFTVFGTSVFPQGIGNTVVSSLSAAIPNINPNINPNFNPNLMQYVANRYEGQTIYEAISSEACRMPQYITERFKQIKDDGFKKLIQWQQTGQAVSVDLYRGALEFCQSVSSGVVPFFNDAYNYVQERFFRLLSQNKNIKSVQLNERATTPPVEGETPAAVKAYSHDFTTYTVNINNSSSLNNGFKYFKCIAPFCDKATLVCNGEVLVSVDNSANRNGNKLKVSVSVPQYFQGQSSLNSSITAIPVQPRGQSPQEAKSVISNLEQNPNVKIPKNQLRNTLSVFKSPSVCLARRNNLPPNIQINDAAFQQALNEQNAFTYNRNISSITCPLPLG